jgi:hypothetical protein
VIAADKQAKTGDRNSIFLIVVANNIPDTHQPELNRRGRGRRLRVVRHAPLFIHALVFIPGCAKVIKPDGSAVVADEINPAAAARTTRLMALVWAARIAVGDTACGLFMNGDTFALDHSESDFSATKLAL